jgi:drug/metabolite transporter (DMT)-like permease
MPVFAAIFSKIFLNESINMRMVITMLFVFVGLGVIAYGSSSSQISSWKGDLWALYVSMAFAAALTAVRRVKNISMVPALPIAYIGAAFLIWPFTAPFAVVAGQWELLIGHGFFIAAGSCLLALGPRYIASAEAALLVLLESVLAPILVWFVIGEDPGSWAIVGGGIVIMALVASNAYELNRRRK